MNILLATAYPPILHMHGGGVRMYHNIRILSERHRVSVLSFVESDEEATRLESLSRFCHSVRAVRRIPDFRPHWLSVKPFMAREFSSPEMHQAVDQTLRAEKIDVLQCEYLQMAQFWRRGVFTVLTAHEALSKNADEAFANEPDPVEKLRLFYRWMQMLRYEAAAVRRFHRVVTMTEDDARYLKSYANGADVRAIPIGVDPEEFAPMENVDQPITALFMGNFRHSPNIEAAGFIVKEIAPRFPEVQFVISGGHVPEDLHAGPNVVFPGYIADTRILYGRPNTIVLAPLFSGSGQRVKLLEAFSMACPVITTSVGALGYPVEHGVQAMIANTADEFEVAMRALVGSQEHRRRLGEHARDMIVERFSWERIGDALLDVVAHPGPHPAEIRGRRRQFPILKYKNGELTPPSPNFGRVRAWASSPWKKLLFPIKAITFIYRFILLLLSTAYLEGTRVPRG